VDPGATGIALLLLLAMAGPIAPHVKKLVDVFYPASNNAADSKVLVFTKWAARVAMVGVAFGFTYWSANFNNRHPTPVDGVWDVIQSQPESWDAIPKTVFFEHNLRNMTVFKNCRWRLQDASLRGRFAREPPDRDLGDLAQQGP
jgi:hypothetical protein